MKETKERYPFFTDLAFEPKTEDEYLWACFAEEQTLGGLFINTYNLAANGLTVIPEVMSIVKPEYFTDYWQGWNGFRSRVYFAMTKCWPEYQTLEPITVLTWLQKNGHKKNHDFDAIQHMINLTGCSLDAPHYARIVKEYGIKRLIKYYTEKGRMDKVQHYLNETPRGGYDL